MDTNTKGFVNLYEIREDLLDSGNSLELMVNEIDFNNEYRESKAVELLNLLGNEEVLSILEEVNKAEWQPVGLDGISKNYKDGDKIGSYRLSVYSEKLANIIYKRIAENIGKNFKVSENILTDAENGSQWYFEGINPLFRFIRYSAGGLLVPHYDGSYKPEPGFRSLKSLVIYLEGEKGIGSTRFIKDNSLLNCNKENLDRSDWNRLAKKDEILFESEVEEGKGLVFDHWMVHDSEPLSESSKVKTIIRTDLMYRKIR